MPKRNPLNLNPLQLRTLTLFQHLARTAGTPEPDGIAIEIPHAHGDHFHLGDAMVSRTDATGLNNPSVHIALDRRDLVVVYAGRIVVTPAGMDYDTGLADKILHRADH